MGVVGFRVCVASWSPRWILWACRVDGAEGFKLLEIRFSGLGCYVVCVWVSVAVVLQICLALAAFSFFSLWVPGSRSRLGCKNGVV